MPSTSISIREKGKKAFAAIASVLLVLSLSTLGLSSASSAPAASASEPASSAQGDFLVEDVSDEHMVPERVRALATKSVSPLALSDRISYLDATAKASAPESPQMFSIVEPGEVTYEPAMATYDFESPVVWKDTRHAKFIDRMDTADVAGYANTVYNNLKKFSDFDGVSDVLIEDDAYMLEDDENKWDATPDASATVGDVIRQDGLNYVVLAKIAVGDNTDWTSSDPRVDNVLNWSYAAWSAYLRDCPEYTYWYTRTLPQISLLPLNYSETKGRFAIVMVTDSKNAAGEETCVRNSQWDSAEKVKSTHSDMMAQVDSLVGQASVLGTDYDKLKLYNKWLCDNNSYQYGASTAEWIPFTAPAALLSMERGPVCEGYAKAMQLLCQRSSIPVTVQTGTTSEPHMWNLVQLAGSWYATDVTANDTGGTPERYLAAGSVTLGTTYKIDDSVVYSLTDGTPYMTFPFANAPQISASDYLVGDETIVSVPEEPIQVRYGQKVEELFPDPSALVKSNKEIEWCAWEDGGVPFSALGLQERRCIIQIAGAGEATTPTVRFEVLPVDVDPQISIATPTVEHTGSAIVPGVSVSHNGQAIDPSNYTVSCRNNVNVGTAILTVESVEGSPYTFSKSVTFQIVEKQDPVGPTPPSHDVVISPAPVYGSVSKISVKGLGEGDTVSYTPVKGSFEVIGDNIVPKSVGECEVMVSVATPPKAARAAFAFNYKFNVAKRPLDVTVRLDDRDYNGTAKATGTVSASNLAQGDGDGSAVTVKIDSATFADANAGSNKPASVKLSVTGPKSNCYTYPTELSATATIRPFDLSKTSVDIAGGNICNGKPVSLADTVSLSGIAGMSVKGTVEWFEDSSMTKKVEPGKTFAGKKGDALPLYYKVTAADTNYTGSKTGSAAFTFADDPVGAGNQNTNENQGSSSNENANQGGSTNTNTNANTGDQNQNQNQGGSNINTSVDENSNQDGSNTNESLNANVSENEPPDAGQASTGGVSGQDGEREGTAASGSSTGADSSSMTQTGDTVLGVVVIALLSLLGCTASIVVNRRRR